MLHLINSAKKQKHKHEPKVPIEQYLYSSDEPQDNASGQSPSRLKEGILEKGYFINRRLKYIVQRIKNYD